MKEVGDGLHEQMNSMMGALQELKLLQVQTALEQMEISGGLNQKSSAGQRPCCWSGHEMSRSQSEHMPVTERTKEKSHSSSSTCSGNFLSPVTSLGSGQQHIHPPFRTMYSDRDLSETASTSSTSPTVECWSPGTFQSTSSHYESLPRTGVGHFHGYSSSLDRDCPDSSISDDAEDWTSSLMSQSRNRQPLVLGDNIFADLVGNWLDLPEVDKKEEEKDDSLSISRSQEVYRKFSLTASIFKKFLRSVRPDKSKLLKEKPGWLLVDDKESEISKRSKKSNKLKGTFYFPFHNNLQNIHCKLEKCMQKEENKGKTTASTRRLQNPVDHARAGFDFNTVVWV